jgi:hypothetical protein
MQRVCMANFQSLRQRRPREAANADSAQVGPGRIRVAGFTPVNAGGSAGGAQSVGTSRVARRP